MRSGLLLGAVVASSLVGARAIHAQRPGDCPSFTNAPQTPEKIMEVSRPAVFLVSCDPNKWGTAYLIDAEGGYLLTASHVLEGCDDGRVRFWHSSSPERGLFQIVKRLGDEMTPPDLALLKEERPKEGPADLATLQPIDVTFSQPRGATVSLGYPKTINQRPANDALVGEPDVAMGRFNKEKDSRFLIGQPAAPGISGGPLLDVYGFASGTAVDESFGQTAWFASMLEARSLLEQIPPSRWVLKLHEKLREGQQNLKELARDLHSRPLRNLDVIAWARLIRDGPDAPGYDAEFFACPFGPLLLDRGLYEYALVLKDLLPPSAVAEASWKQAIERGPRVAPIRFASDSSRLSAEAKAELVAFSQKLKSADVPDGSIVVQGHADRWGSREYNRAIAERRAETVKDFLVSNGVNSSKIVVESRGEELPVCGAATPPCAAEDRRVEFAFSAAAPPGIR